MKRDNEMGVVKSIGLAKDDAGKEVLRAIVDFHEGNSPDIKFSTVWKSVPVKIVECKVDE